MISLLEFVNAWIPQIQKTYTIKLLFPGVYNIQIGVENKKEAKKRVVRSTGFEKGKGRLNRLKLLQLSFGNNRFISIPKRRDGSSAEKRQSSDREGNGYFKE